jgi:hypothetical protein
MRRPTRDYSLIDNAGGKFAIDADDWRGTVAGAIDRDVDASLDITVRRHQRGRLDRRQGVHDRGQRR